VQVIAWLDYKKKADEYITHLLGYEGKHSLTSYLNDEGLINSLSASTTQLNQAYQTIELEIQLTEVAD
jgi:secreted Zn-dependent insulinase-like peptidase